MMIDPLSLLWVRHVAFVYLKLSSKAHGRGFVLSKPRQFVSSEANIEVSSFSCWSPSSLISPLCNKDTNMKMSSHTTLWVSVHNTCKILPHNLGRGWAPGHMCSPPSSSPQTHSPASLQKSKTYSLVWHSLEFFVWKESTYQAWRRLRSRWSSTIIHRVLKLQNIVNSELLASIKLCKLTVCLSIFLNCGTPLKIAKFISYIFFEKPCTVFNI